MVEPIETPVQTEPVAQEPVAVETPLVQRVAKFMETNDPAKAKVQVDEDFKFDVNEIQKIEDPKARELAEKAYKSFQRGFNTKFQEIAELRKALESQGHSTERWTPERIQQLINDPEFIQAAQVVAGNNNPSNSGLTDEEYSALNDREKAQLVMLQREVNSLKQTNMTSMKVQQDASLKNTYANYEPQKVDGLLADMQQGRIQATREHLWKVIDYDSAVQRAYDLGKHDERGGTPERVASLSMQGISIQPNQSIQPEEKESSLSFFQRISRQRLAESKAGKPQRM